MHRTPKGPVTHTDVYDYCLMCQRTGLGMRHASRKYWQYPFKNCDNAERYS